MADNHRSLLEWFHSAGGFVHDAVAVQNLGEFGRGVMVTSAEGVRKGETLMSIGLMSKCLLSSSNSVHSVVQHVVDDDQYSDWWVLTLLVLAECVRDDSFWRPIFQEAPQCYTCALHWTAEDVAELAGAGKSWLSELVHKERDKVLEEFLTVKRTVLDYYSEVFPSDAYTIDLYVWMRAFFKTRGFDFRVSGKDMSVIAPVMDMLNHSSVPSLVTARIVLDMEDEVVRVIAKRDLKNGEQVLICYDPEANSADLLCRYGFVPADNPNCHVALPVLKDLPGCEDVGSDKLWVDASGSLSPKLFSLLDSHFDSDLKLLYEAVANRIAQYLASWTVSTEHYGTLAQDDTLAFVQQCIGKVFIQEHLHLTAFQTAVSKQLSCGCVDVLRRMCEAAVSKS